MKTMTKSCSCALLGIMMTATGYAQNFHQDPNRFHQDANKFQQQNVEKFHQDAQRFEQNASDFQQVPPFGQTNYQSGWNQSNNNPNVNAPQGPGQPTSTYPVNNQVPPPFPSATPNGTPMPTPTPTQTPTQPQMQQ